MGCWWKRSIPKLAWGLGVAGGIGSRIWPEGVAEGVAWGVGEGVVWGVTTCEYKLIQTTLRMTELSFIQDVSRKSILGWIIINIHQ